MKPSLKRLVGGILSASVLLTTLLLSGCSKADTSAKQSDGGGTGKTSLTIIATAFPGYDFAKQICGDKADVSILVPLGMNTHSYEPSPKDIIAIQNCDLFIYTGNESEAWVKKILDTMDKSGPTFLLTEQVELLPVVEEHDHEHDGEDVETEDAHEGEADDHEGGYDEHVWTSPINAKTIVTALSEKIAEIDPDGSDIYKENASFYVAEIATLDQAFRSFFDTVSNRTMVIGDQFALRYFAHDYELDVHAALPSCSTDTEISPGSLKELMDIVKAENLATVFYMQFSSPKIAESIAEPTNAAVRSLHGLHNISKEEQQAGATYVSLMEQNLQTLKEGMS